MNRHVSDIVSSFVLALAASAVVACTIPVTTEGGKGTPTSTQKGTTSGGSGGDPGAQSGQGAEDGGAAQGSIPQELVGKLTNASMTTASLYELAADGTYAYATTYESDVACHTKIIQHASGYAATSGNTMTFHRTTGSLHSVVCNGPEKHKDLGPQEESMTWALEDSNLVLTGETGATTYRR